MWAAIGECKSVDRRLSSRVRAYPASSTQKLRPWCAIHCNQWLYRLLLMAVSAANLQRNLPCRL